MATNAADRSNFVARGRSVAVSPRSSSTTVDTSDHISLLQSLMSKGKMAYVKQVVQLMIETRMEMKSLSKRNEVLLEELRLLREENTSLKER